MIVVDVVRAVSALIGIAGAVITAPYAWPTLWREALAPALRNVAEKMHLVSAPTKNALVDGAAAGEGFFVVKVTATGEAWSNETEQQIAILRERTERLFAGLDELRNEMQQLHSEWTEKLQAATREVQANVQALHDRFDSLDIRTARIDSAGLPVIAVAFVLAGVPEAWVESMWSAGPLMVAALVVTGLATRRALRARHG